MLQLSIGIAHRERGALKGELGSVTRSVCGLLQRISLSLVPDEAKMRYDFDDFDPDLLADFPAFC